MKIVADENIPYLNEFFARYGEVHALSGRGMQAQDLAGADILLVRSVTKVNADLLAQSQVKFVGTCTIGVDHLDLEFLQGAGIAVASAPGCNAGGVVQYVLSALAKLHPTWRSQRIGIVGCGNVGGRLFRVLASAGVNVCAFDPFKHSPDINWVSFDEVLSCDIICLHTPLTRNGTNPTYHLIDTAALQTIKPGALLLNAGRGEVIDNHALLQHLNAGADLQVVLDVWEGEPDLLVPLLHKIQLGTPHIAGYSYEGRVNGSRMIHRALGEFLQVPAAELDSHDNQVMTLALGEAECLHFTDINSTLLDIYDVTRDDQQLRALAVSQGNTAKGFDVLRKEYPKRRELSHYFVSPNLELAPCLRALGFNL